MTDPHYIELHARSAFSFLRAASLPEALSERAAALGIPVMALCDRMGVYGAPRFENSCRETGVRPIHGAELAMDDGSTLPVLVENRIGYQNLCQLLSRAHLRSPKGEGLVRWEEISEFAGGLVALTGDGEGPLVRALLETPFIAEAAPPINRQAGEEGVPVKYSARDQGHGANDRRFEGAAQRVLERMVRIFGHDRVYVEVQRHHRRGEDRLNAGLIGLASACHLPLLATNGVVQATPQGRRVIDVFTCLRRHTTLDEAGAALTVNGECHLKTAAEMKALFADLPQAIAHTSTLAQRLDFRLEDLGYEFPKFPVGSGETMEGVLRDWVFRGARSRYPGGPPEKVRALLEKELAVIQKLGFAGYFLIVADLIRFCRENDILAQGRGSAANSAVCYCLGITAVDPVKFNVLFERFLSEGRKGWPDIDIDLPSGERREKVIQEVYRRYGPHGAAMTATVITYRGRSSAREIGKVLGLPADVLDRFSALFATGDFPHTLDLLAQMEQSGLARAHPRAAAFADLYQQVARLPRHLGQHTGGMVICEGALHRVVPLERASMDGRTVCQWDKDDCEELGIIKVDLLGLGMMAALQDAVALTQRRGRPIDLAQLPPDDAATYKLLRAADTIGVFQVESRAQMATLPRMKPRCFYDLAIEVAIIRPGPIQGDLAHPYLRRKDGVEPVTYWDERLRPVLERTLGVPLFQEQMLQIAMVMGNFTGDEAEELRKALSFHRSDERMRRSQLRLQQAMEKAGVPQAVGEQIARAVGSFALYGFPESHAISFAHLAYASAYLKVHRTAEFYCALLNNQPMGFYSAATLIKDAKRRGLQIRPVCVLQSQWECIIESDGSLRLGLLQVQGMNRQLSQTMIAQRDVCQFASVDDFKSRTRFARDLLRTLAEVGALNALAPHRRAALWQVERRVRTDDLPEHEPVPLKLASSKKPGVKGLPPLDPTPLRPMNAAERLAADLSGLRLTTGPHPMALARGSLAGVWSAEQLRRVTDRKRVTLAGQVICRQRPGTAKGVCFLSLEDETGIANVIVSARLFETERLKITTAAFLKVSGTAQRRHGTVHVRAEVIDWLEIGEWDVADSHDFH